MTLEETIQDMFNNYPDIFQERWECLDYLFCVIGTEYEWAKGQLLENGKQPSKQYRQNLILGPDEKAVQRTSSPEYNTLKILKSKMPSKNQSDKRNWYPLSLLSNLLTYPKDIKADWFDGIKEVKKLLEEDGIIIPKF